MIAPSAPHLLVVDDDARLRALLGLFLKREGFKITVAPNAAAARELLDLLIFDLIVLDVMMPGENGVDFAAALRSSAGRQTDTPILMLSAQAGGAARIEGLQAGVDDYLTKPFEPRELALRINAILRRAGARSSNRGAAVDFGECRFDLENGTLIRNGAPVSLTSREREVLGRLAKAQGAPVARADLLGPDLTERSIDVQITRLRKKIELNPAQPVFLQTVRGIGYRLAAA